MSSGSEAPAGKPGPPAAQVVAGVLFMVLWGIAHLAWAGLSFIADVMANDSGAASEGRHMLLIFGMIAGQVLCGAAGVPAGLAIFRPQRRKVLLRWFAALFVLGALIQGGVFYFFFFSSTP